MLLFTTLLFSLFITIALVPIFKGQAIRMEAVDTPDARKVHEQPIPLVGGLAMTIGMLVPVLLWAPENSFVKSLLIGSGILVVFGFLDDLNNLGYRAKFASQLIAALIVVFYGGLKISCICFLSSGEIMLPDYLGIPLTVLAIVGVTNAINLADGLDGLAGGVSFLSFLCIGFLAYQTGNQAIAIISMAMVGAIFGFLRYNTYPATVFMGDAGSQLLGFLAITLSLSLTQSNSPLSPLLPFLLIGFPVLDTVTVMIERLMKGRSPFMADKNHFHHKLMGLNLYHTEAVLIIYCIQAVMVTSAYFLRYYPDLFILAYYLVFSLLVITAIVMLTAMGWQLHRVQLAIFKGRLKIIKEKNYPIRVTYFLLKVCTPALLLTSCFLPRDVPQMFGIAAAAIFFFLLLVWFFKRNLRGGALQIALFLFIPFIIFLSDTSMASWAQNQIRQVYHLSFVALAMIMFLTLKLTRRKKGFKTSPMDFLILFIAIIVPNIPDLSIQQHQLGQIAAKIIVFFFAYEILMGDIRENWRWVGIPAMAGLLVLVVRGLV